MKTMNGSAKIPARTIHRNIFSIIGGIVAFFLCYVQNNLIAQDA